MVYRDYIECAHISKWSIKLIRHGEYSTIAGLTNDIRRKAVSTVLIHCSDFPSSQIDLIYSSHRLTMATFIHLRV